MSILGRGLLGALSEAGGVVANMMVADHNAETQARHQSERDQALALREENLTRLRAQLTEQSADRAYGRASSTSFDPDTGRQLTNAEAAEYEPDSLIGETQARQMNEVNQNYTLNGAPASNRQIQDAIAANKNLGLIYAGAKKREDDAYSAAAADGPPTPQAVTDAKGKGKLTAEEQEALDSWLGDAGIVGDVRKDAAAAKAELEMNKLQTKYDALKEIIESKTASSEKIADAKLQMAGIIAQMKVAGLNSRAGERADDKVMEAQRKVLAKEADAIAKNGGQVTPELAKTLNAAREAVGLDVLPDSAQGMKPEKAASKADEWISKNAGWLSSDSSDFGTSNRADVKKFVADYYQANGSAPTKDAVKAHFGSGQPAAATTKAAAPSQKAPATAAASQIVDYFKSATPQLFRKGITGDQAQAAMVRELKRQGWKDNQIGQAWAKYRKGA